MTHEDVLRGDVLQTETSKSLRLVLRAARATGALALARRRLRELAVESYAPTPDDLDEGEKFTSSPITAVAASYQKDQTLRAGA